MWAWRDDPLVKVKTMHYYKGHEFNTKTQSGSQSPVIPALGSNALFRTLWAHTHRKTHMHIIKNEIILFLKSGQEGSCRGKLGQMRVACGGGLHNVYTESAHRRKLTSMPVGLSQKLLPWERPSPEQHLSCYAEATVASH